MQLVCSAFGALYAFYAIVSRAVAQTNDGVGFPHDYPGKPSGDFSPDWQDYFEVTASLPNVTFSLPRSFAGNIGVNREGHPNNTLFFWGFEKDNGSLTAAAGDSDAPWGIWLNGGPGSSSLIGLHIENGPIHVNDNYSVTQNPFAWSNVADYIWVDQPVGTGYSTVDEDGFVEDEDQMGADFLGFLSNLVKVFPSLATRPLHITGESYAGTYIPYITKAIFSSPNPPVKLASIAIGDGTLADSTVFEQLPVLTVIETHPQLIGYDPQVYQYFKTQEHLCGYDLNFTYPQTTGFQPIPFVPGTIDQGQSRSPFSAQRSRITSRKGLSAALNERKSKLDTGSKSKSKRELDSEKLAWKRDLKGRPTNSIDPFYGCDLFDEMIDYALNFSVPWSNVQQYDVYDVPDGLAPEPAQDPSVFLNDPSVVAAIHAPTSKQWQESIFYMFNNSEQGDPSPSPMNFLTDLATNATARNVSVVIYSGNDDSLVPHRGSEAAIQNTTFGGIRGFTRQPSTPWTTDDGTFAGIVHQERNWTYVLFRGAGHLVPYYQPAAAFTFVKNFVFGHNETGLVSGSNVVGGENSTFAAAVMPADNGIFVGAGVTQSTYVAPTATIAAWNKFIQTATATAPGSSQTTKPKSSAWRGVSVLGGRWLSMVPIVFAFLL